MGVVDLFDDPSGDRAQAAVEEEYENKAQWLDALRQHESRNALVHTPVDSHRRDLFASYPPIAGRPSMESIDEYVWTFQKEELCLHITPGMEHPTLSVMVPMAIQDPGLFKCLITAAQSLYERRRNPDPRGSVRSKALILAQNDAIQALQKRLAQPDAPFDDGVVMSVLHLMTADSSAADLPALKMHLKGARQIIALRGGLGGSPAHLALRGTMSTTEFYIALAQYLRLSPDDRSAMPMQPITYVGHPFPPKVCDYVAKMPVGIAEAALTGQLSVRCMKMLAELSQWAPLADRGLAGSGQQAQQPQQPEPQPQDVQMARYARLYCAPREFARDAMMLVLDLQRSGIPPGLEHVTASGLATIVRHMSEQNPTTIFDHMSLNILLANVKAIDTPTVAESEVIIWLALVVKWRTQSAKGPSPKADELLEYALESFPATRTWNKGMAKICRKFWWFGRFETEWKATWQRGLERLEQRRRRVVEEKKGLA
ncbi:hypothetical protein H2202_008157 [Exophiala xenobiotica]|nr:hypothetical protein H2202_008157 [Exophiala xenobiotica]KAK5203422.1 hypothetical protein LTR41_010883 [Exophiala xenobiotica]KAK5219509.1 hypothetical protein LTR72_007893 [Exophiala xenobiotica]KAK5223169.1 hypothetical protein LTR47_010345 [Exophiala xenobiotica]KAK5252543.1 hypothetical protein LTS06_002950 [Exophiala xenobiotica]